MKRIITLIIFFTLCPISYLFAQEQTYRGVVEVTSQELRESNDSLYLKMSIRVLDDAVDNCTSIRLIPELTTSANKKMLPSILLNGKVRKKLNDRWFTVADIDDVIAYSRPLLQATSQDYNETVLTYEMVLPYELWMDDAKLTLHQELRICGHGTRLLTLLLDSNVKLEEKKPYEIQPLVSYVTPEKEVKVRNHQGKAYLDFQVGRSVILPNFRRNPEELSKIDAVISEIQNNSDVVIKGLFIEGYASPEGVYTTNERLAQERAKALKEYIKTKFSIPEGFFKVTSVAEDWDGLTELVKDSELKEKDKILEIISGIDILDGREAALMRLNKGIPYRVMLREMFPSLRRVEYQVDYTVKDYSVEESKNLYHKNPKDLSQLELYALAQNFGKGTKEYNTIMIELTPKYFGSSDVANNNAAAALLENNELASAKRFLEKVQDNDASLNNKGVLLMNLGDLDNAEKAFKEALKKGNKEASHNLEELNKKRESNIKMERYKNRK